MNNNGQTEFKVGDELFYVDGHTRAIHKSKIESTSITEICGNEVINFENGKTLYVEEVYKSREECISIIKNFYPEEIDIRIAEINVGDEVWYWDRKILKICISKLKYTVELDVLVAILDNSFAITDYVYYDELFHSREECVKHIKKSELNLISRDIAYLEEKIQSLLYKKDKIIEAIK